MGPVVLLQTNGVVCGAAARDNCLVFKSGKSAYLTQPSKRRFNIVANACFNGVRRMSAKAASAGDFGVKKDFFNSMGHARDALSLVSA